MRGFYQGLLVTLFTFLMSLDCNASELKSYTNDKINARLLKASQNGNVEVVEELLKKRADINSFNINGETPLILATQNGKQKLLDMLLSFEPDVNQQDCMKNTALMYTLPNELSPNYPPGDPVNYPVENPDDLGVDDDVLKMRKAEKIVFYSKLAHSLIQACADPTIKNIVGKNFQDCIAPNENDDKDIKEFKQFIKNGPNDIIELIQKLLNEE